MRIPLSPSSLLDYKKYLAIKQLPRYRISGEFAEFPDEYASRVGLAVAEPVKIEYEPWRGLFDYQGDITGKLCLRRRKFAVFAACGLGKTLIFLEYCRTIEKTMPAGKCILIISPPMVVSQTVAEAQRFYGDSLSIEIISAKRLASWLRDSDGSRIGITNYEALKDDTPQGRLHALILDESSMLKSHYGKWGNTCIRLGKGLEWKLALTGTPAPNDRIEFANHAVFLDQHPTVNSFLARYFVNKGNTSGRWELKPHAIGSFYRDLSHWCIFLENPGTYGWKDNCHTIPPINVHIHEVGLTSMQRLMVQDSTQSLFVGEIGGIVKRASLSKIAKGIDKKGNRTIDTLKPEYMKALIDSWPDESTILWCWYNAEQELMEKIFPVAASIAGDTPDRKRHELIQDFKDGKRRILISKPKILGFGLNLQVASRQVFSSLIDSYEAFHQCVKRSNRIGSTRPLNVHLPVTEIERPMIDTVLRKAKRIDADTLEQERLFRDRGHEFLGVG